MAHFLLLAMVLQMTDNRSPIAADETVRFFPTYAKQADDGSWEFRVRGWIFEPEADSLKRRALVAGFEKLFDVGDDAAAAEIFRARMAPFLVDNERNKAIAIQVGARQHPVGVSAENGHFEGTPKLSAEDVAKLRKESAIVPLQGQPGTEYLEFKAVTASGDERTFLGQVFLIPPTGVSVISDIDDTIKITEVGSRQKLLQNTLFKPFEAVPGMADLYRRWAADGVAFHYVTASPWQLFEPLCGLCGPKGFPTGSWDMKLFRLKDSTAFDLFRTPEEYKPEIIERIVRDFPRRKFILIGDSGERDPEIYGGIARKYPEHIERILIRSVTDDLPQGERYQAAFTELPSERWQVFKTPDEIKPLR